MIYSSENTNADEIDFLVTASRTVPSRTEPCRTFFAVSDGILLTKIGPGSVEIFKSFRVMIDDPCYKFLPLPLKSTTSTRPGSNMPYTLPMMIWSDAWEWMRSHFRFSMNLKSKERSQYLC
jgi:hypothetical protein